MYYILLVLTFVAAWALSKWCGLMPLLYRMIFRVAVGLFPTALVGFFILKGAIDGEDLHDPKVIYLTVWSLPVTLSAICGSWLATRKRALRTE